MAQGGDWGAIITDLMAAQAPPGLIGMHTNMAAVVPLEIDKLYTHMGEGTPALKAVYRPVQHQTTLEETVKRLGTAIRLGVVAPGSQARRFRCPRLSSSARIFRPVFRRAPPAIGRFSNIREPGRACFGRTCGPVVAPRASV